MVLIGHLDRYDILAKWQPIDGILPYPQGASLHGNAFFAGKLYEDSRVSSFRSRDTGQLIIDRCRTAHSLHQGRHVGCLIAIAQGRCVGMMVHNYRVRREYRVLSIKISNLYIRARAEECGKEKHGRQEKVMMDEIFHALKSIRIALSQTSFEKRRRGRTDVLEITECKVIDQGMYYPCVCRDIVRCHLTAFCRFL